MRRVFTNNGTTIILVTNTFILAAGRAGAGINTAMGTLMLAATKGVYTLPPQGLVTQIVEAQVRLGLIGHSHAGRDLPRTININCCRNFRCMVSNRFFFQPLLHSHAQSGKSTLSVPQAQLKTIAGAPPPGGAVSVDAAVRSVGVVPTTTGNDPSSSLLLPMALNYSLLLGPGAVMYRSTSDASFIRLPMLIGPTTTTKVALPVTSYTIFAVEKGNATVGECEHAPIKGDQLVRWRLPHVCRCAREVRVCGHAVHYYGVVQSPRPTCASCVPCTPVDRPYVTNEGFAWCILAPPCLAALLSPGCPRLRTRPALPGPARPRASGVLAQLPHSCCCPQTDTQPVSCLSALQPPFPTGGSVCTRVCGLRQWHVLRLRLWFLFPGRRQPLFRRALHSLRGGVRRVGGVLADHADHDVQR